MERKLGQSERISQRGNGHCEIPFDPRTLFILLMLTNFFAFMNKPIEMELMLIISLFFFMIYCQMMMVSIKLMCLFGGILFFQYVILPNDLPAFITIFAILSSYIRKVVPSIMIGAVIVKRVPLSYFILAMRKCRLPEKLILALTVTIRYFPAILQERRYIKDALKMRQVSGIQQFEAYMVPLMVSAINTADELSAAAVTRGVESPVKKTSHVVIQFELKDFLVIGLGLILILLSMIGG